jgi:hypothetical protein
MSQPLNPYQVTADPGPNESGTDERPYPLSVKVFGILNLVFAVWGLLGLGFSAAMMVAASSGYFPSNPAYEALNESVFFTVYNYAMTAAGFVATVVLAAAGIGLLKGRNYGRVLSIGYAVYAIVSAILGMLVNAIFLFPTMFDQGNASTATITGAVVGTVIGGLIGLIYPVLLLVFMTRSNVVDALRGR